MKMHWFPFIALALILVSAGLRRFFEKDRKTSIALVVLGILIFAFGCLWKM